MAKKDKKDTTLEITTYSKAYKYIQANREYPGQPEYQLVDKLIKKYQSTDDEEKRKNYKEILDEFKQILNEKLKIYEERLEKLKALLVDAYNYEQNKLYN